MGFSVKLTLVCVLLIAFLLGYNIFTVVPSIYAQPASPLSSDALRVPVRTRVAAYADDAVPNEYQPSAFLAGNVAVQVVFVESNGQYEPSTHDWTSSQMAQIRQRISTALQWWAARLPQAQLHFDITSQVVPSGYEPVTHDLSTESLWVGDALQHMGINAPNYFDQAYAADEALRRERKADWATHIFVVNSTGTATGRFADGHFAYAYINGPFMVITSDAGPYGTSQLSPIVAHEFGHIFGAVDQYAAAAVPCTEQSGYLAVPTTNSQANNCGTQYNSIMLDPIGAYAANAIDASALGQLGYRDSNSNGLLDPIDTTPLLQLQLSQATPGARPLVSGQAFDQAYPSPGGDLASINTITKVEYRIDGGAWLPLPTADGVYDAVSEKLNATLPLYDGPHNVAFRATNRIGAISPIVSYNVAVSGIGAAPSYQVSAPTMSNTQHMMLALNAPAGAGVQVSENPAFTDASWVPASASLDWALSNLDGEHTVYVRFRDTAGLESPPFVLTTMLDRTPPAGRAMLLKRSNSLWLEIQAQDSESQIDAMQISLDPNTAGSWQPFQPSTLVSLQANTMYVRLRDAAGNVSPPMSAMLEMPVWVPIAVR